MNGLSPCVTLPRLLHNRLGLKRGVGRVMMAVAQHNPALQLLPVRMNDGRVLQLDLREPMAMPYLLAGEIWEEAGETEFVRSVVCPGEVAIDIGANVGWYSALLSECVGATGAVYAFEPMERALTMLGATARQYPQLRVIAAALGALEGEAVIHVPARSEERRVGKECRL